MCNWHIETKILIGYSTRFEMGELRSDQNGTKEVQIINAEMEKKTQD